MTTSNQDQALNLAAANQAAKQNFPAEDLGSSVSACPARQAEVFVVPVRYALSEEKAEHPSVQPIRQTFSHPMALRRLRPGYLYLWQADGPLQRFAVAEDGRLLEQPLEAGHSEVAQGALTGLKLNKARSAWMMHAERPLSAQHCDRLKTPSVRRRHMRQLDLPGVARKLTAEHCPPLSEASQLIAELLPESYDKALAAEHVENGEQQQQRLDQVYSTIGTFDTAEQNAAAADAWLRLKAEQEKCSAAAERHPDAAEHKPGEWSTVAWDAFACEAWLDLARSQAGALHAVLACLDDDLGALRDLNNEQGLINIRHEQWNQQNGNKGMIAGFINSLINEDGAELGNLINYRYRAGEELQLTPEEGDQLLKAHNELKPLLDEETRINRERGRQYSHAQADELLRQVHYDEQQVLLPTRSFIPPHLHNEIRAVVMGYTADKARNMTDSRSGAQVAERVRLDAMQSWMDNEAAPHHRGLAERRDSLLQDSETFLAVHGDSLWYANYDDAEHCDWLSHLSLASLSELCSSGPGIQVAVNLLRSPSPEHPFSLLSNGFSPELVDLSERSDEVMAALTSQNQAAVGQLLGSLVSKGKLEWLSGLGGAQANSWDLATSRLSAAYMELELKHLTGALDATEAQNLIARFPAPLKGMLLVTRWFSKAVFATGDFGYKMSGIVGRELWDAAQEIGRDLQKGLAPSVATVRSLNTLGGVLPLTALLLHLSNWGALKEREQVQKADAVRDWEQTAEGLNLAAALSAVIGASWEATGRTAISLKVKGASIQAPIVTLFGAITGVFASVAAFFDLGKLAAEMQRQDSYWTGNHWARLGYGGAIFGLMATQTGLGGYATYMALTNRWTVGQAIAWFGLRIVPVNWLILLIEGLRLSWDYFKDSELQQFLEQCCWGNQRRWNDSPEQASAELQNLIDLLFKPRLQATGLLTSRQYGQSDHGIAIASNTHSLQLALPGAEPHRTQLLLRLAAIDDLGRSSDCTRQWLAGVQSQWLPVQQGMGLCLSGKLPSQPEGTHWQLQVLYYSPLAMLASTLNPSKLAVGGAQGMRYIIRGASIIEHSSEDGPLAVDNLALITVDPKLLQPKEDA
jgi:hypothetical protein